MTKEKYFLKKVEFQVYLKRMNYFQEFDKNNSLLKIQRKAVYDGSLTPISGVIVGDKKYYEGEHKVKAQDSFNTYEPEALTNKKAVQVYVVAVGFNTLYEVEKSYLENINHFGKGFKAKKKEGSL